MGLESNTVSDEELARESKAGSLVSFEALVSRYERRIYGFVANSCRHETDAREITQDTFVRAFQALDQFDSRKTFGPWLFAIARRKSIDHHRSSPPPPTTDEVPDQPDLDDPAELLTRKEDRQTLWQLARRRLADAQFQALWLRYVDDMNVTDIARVLGKTRTHIKVLLFRARQTLAADPGLIQAEHLSKRQSLPCIPAIPNNQNHEILAHTV